MPDYTGRVAKLNQLRKDTQKKAKKKNKVPDQVSKITAVEFFLVFVLSILKDFLDWVLLFAGGIGLILSRITNIVITGILWLWCFFRLRKFPTKRFLGGFTVEMIPLLGTFSPTWTIFITTIWIEQSGFTPKWVKKLV